MKLIIEDNGIGMSEGAHKTRNDSERIKEFGESSREGGGIETTKEEAAVTSSENLELAFTRRLWLGKVEVHTSNGNEFSVDIGRSGEVYRQRIERGAKAERTKIVIHMKDDCKTIASQWAIEETLKKYSAFVSFPIYINENKFNEIGALDEETCRSFGRTGDDVYNTFLERRIRQRFECILKRMRL